jgi:hypothetical protein
MTLLAVLTDGLSSARLSREHDNSGDPHLMREHFESHILNVSTFMPTRATVRVPFDVVQGEPGQLTHP